MSDGFYTEKKYMFAKYPLCLFNCIKIVTLVMVTGFNISTRGRISLLCDEFMFKEVFLFL